MVSLRYLTVQDILWINLVATGAPQPFRYLDLEEAAYFQYGYGASVNLFAQAASFWIGFQKKRPFSAGNEATAFLAFAAFLRTNGRELTVPDSKSLSWSKSLGGDGAAEVVEKSTRPIQEHEPPDVEAAIRTIIDAYPKTLRDLGAAIAVQA